MVVSDHSGHHLLMSQMFQILQVAAIVLAGLEISMSMRCLLGQRARRAAR